VSRKWVLQEDKLDRSTIRKPGSGSRGEIQEF
jgi:hypothetical protein